MAENRVIIFSAPSGSGKTTIVKYLLERFSELKFSISATSREPRGAEVDGVDYFFLSNEQFKQRIDEGDFIEWEEVYSGVCYGTLRSETERIWSEGKTIVFDVDVKGGQRLKELFKDQALSIFIMPPSVEELRSRLENRATDSAETIDKRVKKAAIEIEDAQNFDTIIVNDRLEEAFDKADKTIANFLS